jgi:hypothetical protein
MDASDASGGDCDKLAASLEALEPDAKALHGELVAANKKLADFTPEGTLAARLASPKDPGLFDRCEKDSPRANHALDQTLLVVAPLSDDPALGKAMGDAIGKAAATK